MANGTKELNTSPITIEDEINEFSEKPVQGKTLYKKLKELEDGTLPDTTDASVGNALVLDEDKKPTWGEVGGGGGGTLYKRYITCQGSFNVTHNFDVTFLTYSLTNTAPLTDVTLFPCPIVFESSPVDPNEDDPIMLWTDGIGSITFKGNSYVGFMNVKELSASYSNSFTANVTQYFERI